MSAALNYNLISVVLEMKFANEWKYRWRKMICIGCSFPELSYKEHKEQCASLFQLWCCVLQHIKDGVCQCNIHEHPSAAVTGILSLPVLSSFRILHYSPYSNLIWCSVPFCYCLFMHSVLIFMTMLVIVRSKSGDV